MLVRPPQSQLSLRISMPWKVRCHMFIEPWLTKQWWQTANHGKNSNAKAKSRWGSGPGVASTVQFLKQDKYNEKWDFANNTVCVQQRTKPGDMRTLAKRGTFGLTRPVESGRVVVTSMKLESTCINMSRVQLMYGVFCCMQCWQSSCRIATVLKANGSIFWKLDLLWNSRLWLTRTC